ncbi:MAG: TatD family hydrolase [Candidatus Hydrogenedentes bacterium]|nr:TatD family hydrolase [Candidatus Hydrogenedentota bacterium]
MRLVDTHCHLQHHRFDDDRQEVLARALGVLEWLVVIGDDLESSRAAAALVQDRVYATVGLHPYHAEQLDDDTLAELRALAAQPGVKAIGEIGLDYFNEYAPRPAQHQAFERQLELACELGLPVVIHNRSSDDDCYAILKNFANRLPGCIMHCFGSDAAYAERCVDLGFHVSFAGNAAFPKAPELREAAAAVPLDRLLVETDAPYLAPPPLRGKRCEPQYVVHTAECLAEVKGVSPEEFAAHTTANAHALYRVA